MAIAIRRAVIAGLVGVVACNLGLMHPDDLKERDTQKPYRGPGYRAGEGGVAGIGFPSENVSLLSWLPLGEFGAQHIAGADCWGYVSPSGGEYALMGLWAGTGFVDITDPTAPVILDVIDGPAGTWRDIKVYQDHAYVVSEDGDGIQVVDLSDIYNGVVTLVNTVLTGGGDDTHNVAINTDSGFLYRCGGGSNDGLRVYDLVDPANPEFVGQWSERYVHDAQIVTYTEGPFAGREIAFCCGGFDGGFTQTGLHIVDVTDKNDMFMVSQMFYNNAAYSHQAWLNDDKSLLYLNDEGDESDFGLPTTTQIIDVTDIEQPFVANVSDNGNPAIGHNLYLVGDLMYQANYRSGLRVFDLADDPLNPVEIGHFDTYPDDDSANFNGLWSVYPYFPSGTIIGSDREKGLFVWIGGALPLSFEFPDGVPPILDPQGQTIAVRVIEEAGELVDGSATLIYDAGGGAEGVELVHIADDLFEAVFPALECAASVNFYFEAMATNGLIIRSPSGAPIDTYAATVASKLIVAFEDELEADTGWTVGDAGDDATTGIWDRVDPLGTDAQPEDDHTVDGTICFVTGQGEKGGGLGDNDVDDGKTTLITPALDLVGLDDAVLSYWRWYSNTEGNSPNADIFVIDISNDDGANWTTVETVGPGGAETSGGWFQHSLNVADFVDPTDTVRLRFIASDENDGSIVEAAVDDLQIVQIVCDDGVPGDIDGDGLVGTGDLLLLLGAWGPCDDCDDCAEDLDDDCLVGTTDLLILLGNWG